MLSKDISYALALEGGGTKGAYQAGALLALDEAEIPIKAVAGTSVGSLNGALFAQGDAPLLKSIWEEVKASDIIDIEDQLAESISRFDLASLSYHQAGKQLLRTLKEGGLNIQPFKHFVNHYISEEKLRKSPIDFGLVTVNLSDMRPQQLMKADMPEGSIADYLMASSYLPAFKRQKIQGKYYLDGGFYNQIPTSLLSEKGYDHIIEVRLNSIGPVQTSKKEVTLHTLTPHEALGGLLEFDRQRIRYNLRLGYYDMYRLIEDLPGTSYYFKDKQKTGYYLKLLLSFSKGYVNQWSNRPFLSDRRPKERLILEKWVPYLAQKLKLPPHFTYEMVCLALMEQWGDYYDLDRFRFYTYKRFAKEVIDHYKKDPNKGEVDVKSMLNIGLRLLHMIYYHT